MSHDQCFVTYGIIVKGADICAKELFNKISAIGLELSYGKSPYRIRVVAAYDDKAQDVAYYLIRPDDLWDPLIKSSTHRDVLLQGPKISLPSSYLAILGEIGASLSAEVNLLVMHAPSRCDQFVFS